MKVLIIQTASIGDVILVTPLLEALRHHFPKCKPDILVAGSNASLFEGHPFLNDTITWNKRRGKYRNLLKIIRLIRKRRYDHVINVQRFFSSGLITLLSGAAATSGFNKNPLSRFFTYRTKHIIGIENVHEADRNLKLLSYLGINSHYPAKLYPSEADFQKVSALKSVRYITIAPASLWITKAYPEEKWIEFVDHLPDGIHCYILGSGNDIMLAENIRNRSTNSAVKVLAGDLSLLETAALMSDSLMNYTNDSAPMHIASAMNAPVTAIFCSTVPGFGFGPLSEKSFILETDEDLSCRPCGIHGRKSCPEGHFRCGYGISVSKLLLKIE